MNCLQKPLHRLCLKFQSKQITSKSDLEMDDSILYFMAKPYDLDSSFLKADT